MRFSVRTAVAIALALGFSQSLFAANENLLSLKVFQGLCANVVQPVSGGWALDRPQFEIADSGLYYTQRHHADSVSDYSVNVSVDGITTRELSNFPNQIRDLKLADGKVWVLFDGELMALDAATGKRLTSIKTYNGSMSTPNHDHANEFVIVNGKAYIAHGTFGVNVIDLATGGLVQQHSLGLRQPNGHQSKAVGIATDGRYLFIMVDSVTMPTQKDRAFNGIIQAPINSPSGYTKYDIDVRSSGVITQVIGTSVVNGTIYMNNWGNMQSLAVSSLVASKGSTFAAPYKRVLYTFENKDHSVELMGDLLISNGQYYGCGKISPDDVATHTIRRMGIVAQGSL